MTSHTVHSFCPLDCPDRCSLEVRVEEGRVVALEGSTVNPITSGFICAKVRRYPERLYGPDRLSYPMRRTGPKGDATFERVSWDEALGTIAENLDEVRRTHGGECILPFSYGGSNGHLSQGIGDERLFRALGASRLARTVCAAQTGAASQALYGKMASVDFPDFVHARVILIWGANPRHSNVHLMPYLHRARDAGAKVVLVDPRRTLEESWFDWHLAVRPGTDVVLALAMIAHLERTGAVDRGFLEAHTTGGARLLEQAREWTLERAAEITGVPARDIAAVTEVYAAADPALVRCGWGVERNRNGEAAVAAILALPAVAGKFGRPGGGYALSSSEAHGFNAERLIGIPESSTRIVNMSQLGRVLLEAVPPVRALFVYDANPAVTLPDQNRVQRGLARADLFTVVFDQVMTDTARYADVLLPATTFLEARELSSSYGTYAVMLAEPVVPAVGEARSNESVFASLAERLGVSREVASGGDREGPTQHPPDENEQRSEARFTRAKRSGGARGGAAQHPPDEDEWLGEVLASFERPYRGDPSTDDRVQLGRDRLARLRRDLVLQPSFEGGSPIQFANVFPGTTDRKVHLWPGDLGPEPYAFVALDHDAAHPLALISPSSDRSICSTLGEVGFSKVFVEMNPDDARTRGLRDGEEVRVHNPLGEVRVPLRLSPSLRPGVVLLPKGIWNRHTRNGSVGTALVPDAVSPLTGGACFNDARVEVTSSFEPLPTSSFEPAP